jgi:hypothetical protein
LYDVGFGVVGWSWVRGEGVGVGGSAGLFLFLCCCGGVGARGFGLGEDVDWRGAIAAGRDLGRVHDGDGLVLFADSLDGRAELVDLSLGHFGGHAGDVEVELGLLVEVEVGFSVEAQVLAVRFFSPWV